MYIYIYIGYSSGGETLPTVHSKNGCTRCNRKRQYQKMQYSLALYRGVTHWLLTRWDVGSSSCIGILLIYSIFQSVLQTQKSYQILQHNSYTRSVILSWIMMIGRICWWIHKYISVKGLNSSTSTPTLDKVFMIVVTSNLTVYGVHRTGFKIWFRFRLNF